MGGGIGQVTTQPECLPPSALAHRDLQAGVPPIKLGDLPGQIARALEAAGGQEGGSHPGQMILEDGDPPG